MIINFFRKVRRNLLPQNPITRYLMYALGEILLVVIGILIALQANNWNEHRRTREEIQKTQNALAQELRTNITKVRSYIDKGYELGEVLDSLKANRYKETIKKARGSFYGDFGVFDTFTFDLETENLDAWINYEKELSSEKSGLLTQAKRVKDLISSREHWESLSTELSTTRFKEFVDELPWFYDTDGSSAAKRRYYILNDPFFRNKAIHYLTFQLNENLWYSTLFRSQAIKLLWELDTKKAGESADAIRSFLESFGFRSMEKLECQSFPYHGKERLGYRNSLLVWNTTNDTIKYQIVDTLGVKSYSSFLLPKKLNQWPVYDGSFIQLEEPCKSVFAPTQHGYLLIE